MEPVSIDVDGSIDLIERADASDSSGSDTDRTRQSRLNDVMIVLEREHATLESGLSERLARTVWPDGMPLLAIHFDETAPRFHVAIQTMPEAASGGALSTEQRRVLEKEIAAEIVSTIEQRAVHSEKPRWEPSVTATLREVTAAKGSQSRTAATSIWRKTLFGLLAIVVLGTLYIYFKGATT